MTQDSRFFRWCVAVTVLVALAWIILTLPANAEWPQDAFSCKSYRADLVWRNWARRHCHQYRQRRWKVRHVPVASSVGVPKVGSQHCPSTIINVVSGERQGEDKAKGDARKMFMGEASARYGLVYAELSYAKNIRWRCFPAQAHDTWTGALSKGANRMMGGDGQNIRCELWASPCSVPVQGD
jgi:hypothetical protein